MGRVKDHFWDEINAQLRGDVQPCPNCGMNETFIKQLKAEVLRLREKYEPECPECGGEGYVPGDDPFQDDRCPSCGGSGEAK